MHFALHLQSIKNTEEIFSSKGTAGGLKGKVGFCSSVGRAIHF